ncbi:MAG: C-terminal processing protease CtpA/Prc [Chlamydiales bacterium]
MRAGHPVPFIFGVSEEGFAAAVDDLERRIPELEDGRIVMEIFPVFALLDDPAESFDAFTDRLFAFAEENDIERIVIDMRKNCGGYGRFGLRFVERIAQHELGKEGNLFVILGRGTKSATPFFAQRLSVAASPLFVGEQSGGRPTPVGNTFPIDLPHSAVGLRCGGRLFQLTSELDLGKTILPDIPALATMESFRANEDPVLAAAIEHGRSAGR